MRKRYLQTLFAAMAVWAMLVPQAANAHSTTATRNGIIGGEPGFCVYGGVTQTHSWHDVSTFASNCQNMVPVWHTQKQEYYKVAGGGQPGVFCFSEGWYQSPAKQNSFYKFYGWDIWHRCNNGLHVNVILTVDSWQFSWKSDWEGWRGGAWRPATSHCHCP